ncbi:ABC transporter substrate-binding protein [Agrobacterium rhizogenes]|uniref:ABC transporter substrate-binding protein n=1 Tax=Rhizobium rhizogenes TaxID=359 RepID=UPI0015740290|nr:ABC transporter substrate-binding protein [Rhizobium rhizogenes]NTF52958.1 ABC transporter substrate-binding protein [Rhizobium rhizogenes]NTH10168.1 ABC transporter substrate-binding protein [Rhizobium rhizogenes]NTH42720.1 ABC transporter substrate-binding protein [Rhizobium rhizogenes]NTI06727.1 ABC transporter substrate-binding protein [Rhizobium rhizogenes]NTI13532.1 ABC transporter substrate-binding protein [Rhizobium rhizogenes]
MPLFYRARSTRGRSYVPPRRRRGLLKTVAFLAGAPFLFGAPQAFAATPADTLVVAKYISDLITLDPAEVYEATGGEVVNNVYERLITFDPSDFTRPVGGVAESWKVSDDGLTFTFKIRDGLFFASGRGVTAEDAAFSLERVIRLGKTPVFYLTQFGWSKENIANRVSFTDEKTLVLKLDKPYAPDLFLKVLSSTVSSVVDKQEALKHETDGDLGAGWLKKNTAGSGPYQLTGWTPNEAVVLTANAHYKREPVALKNVVLRHIPEAATQRLLIEKGDVDIARNLSADQIQALSTNSNITIISSPKTDVSYIALNRGVKPLDDDKVQQALRWAIDYDGIVGSILKGQAKVHQSFWGSGSGGSLDETPYKLDIAKAKSLLEAAGYRDGFKLKLDVSSRSPDREISQSLQSTFGQAGVKVELNTLDRAQLQTRFRGRQHDAVFFGWSPDYLDVHASASFFTINDDDSDNSKNKNAAWRDHWLVPELTKKTLSGLTEADPAKREAIYLDLQKQVRDNSPFIVIYQQLGQVPVRANVKGFVPGPSWDTPAYWRTTKS